MAGMFRDLRADEIECRVARCGDWGAMLLLYKDARCDQIILDETVGAMNWTRTHSRDNANCTVSIWDESKRQWIGKEDTGTESNTEKEKGLASDSFKRACFNWGIGRELYTAPTIIIHANQCEKLKEKNGRWQCYDEFEVAGMTIENKRIIGLRIRNNSKDGRIVYTMGEQPAAAEERPAAKAKPSAAKGQDKPAAKVAVTASDTVQAEAPIDKKKQCEWYNIVLQELGISKDEMSRRFVEARDELDYDSETLTDEQVKNVLRAVRKAVKADAGKAAGKA